MKLCPNGHPNPDDAQFCSVCHAYLGWQSDQPPPAPPPAPPGQPAPAPQAGVTGTLTPPEVAVRPGSEATAELRVRNTGAVVDQYAFEVEGPAAAWITPVPVTLSLLPGAEGTAQLHLRPPASPAVPAGPISFTVRVVSRADLQASVTVQGTAQVGAAGGVTASLAPQTSRARMQDSFAFTLSNGGNTPVNATVSATSSDGQLTFTVAPQAVAAAAGGQATASVGARAAKPIVLGQETTHLFTVTAQPEGGAPLQAQGTMIQRPLAPKWVMAAVPVIIAALSFLGVKVIGGGGNAPPVHVTITGPQKISIPIICLVKPCKGSGQFTITADQSNIDFFCSLDGETPTACLSPKTVTVVATGPHTFHVDGKDQNGRLVAQADFAFTAQTFFIFSPLPFPFPSIVLPTPT